MDLVENKKPRKQEVGGMEAWEGIEHENDPRAPRNGPIP